ncbi:MAG: DUF368 domain-containing protein [Bacteroidales bacterium]|nr:DUF368 domain-containing protein [Bacteroidales bacterium]
MYKHLITALKGFGMGAANVVPGVSGGTIALLTGIYTELIEAINSLMDMSVWKLLLKGKLSEFWKAAHGPFLLAVFVGVVLSILTLARVMEYSIVHYPVQTWAFFFGLIIASAIYMILDIRDKKAGDLIWGVAGLALGLVVCTLTPTSTPDSMPFIFLCGAIAVCTMILPGVSGSFVLVIMGKYEFIMSALNNMDLPVLGVFILGCVVGLLAFAKFLHWLLARCERQTMLVLVGFVLGSLVKVWPWNNMEAVRTANLLGGLDPGAMHIPGAILWGVAGLALVILLEILSKKKS